MTSSMPAKTSAKTLMRLGVIGLAAAATLAGCNRNKTEPAAPAAAPATANAPALSTAPLDFNSKTTFANVALKMPEAVKGQPELHTALYDASVKDLRTFTEGAQADRTEAGGDGGMAPYEKTITFDDAVETGKLFSLARADYDYSGGAHGNTLYAGVLWDKGLKRRITGADLFIKGADYSALDRALCAALNTAKRARDPKAATVTLGGKDWSCPLASRTPFVLTAGTTPGKAGGLTFLVGPYQIGPYSDGAYQVSLPQTAFRTLLAPVYADEFAGQPVALPAKPKA